MAARIGLRFCREHSVITVVADAAAASDVTLAVNSCSSQVLLPLTVGCNRHATGALSVVLPSYRLYVIS